MLFRSSGDYVNFHSIDIRDFADNDYKQIDDTPFGGGDGMVLMAEPLMRSIEHSFNLMSSSIEDTHIIYPTTQSSQRNQEHATNTVHIKNSIFICGRYKCYCVYVRIRDYRVLENALKSITLTLIDGMNADLDPDFKNKSVPSLLINLHLDPVNLAIIFYTLLFLGGLHPLCGRGVISVMFVILYPELFKALTAESLPGPGPLTSTSKLFTPNSAAFIPAFSAAI